MLATLWVPKTQTGWWLPPLGPPGAATGPDLRLHQGPGLPKVTPHGGDPHGAVGATGSQVCLLQAFYQPQFLYGRLPGLVASLYTRNCGGGSWTHFVFPTPEAGAMIIVPLYREGGSSLRTWAPHSSLYLEGPSCPVPTGLVLCSLSSQPCCPSNSSTPSPCLVPGWLSCCPNRL